MSCKNKLDGSSCCCKFYVASMGRRRTILTYASQTTNADNKSCLLTLLRPRFAKIVSTIVGETDTRQLLMQYKLHVERKTGLSQVYK
jgi:hypothetical protein